MGSSAQSEKVISGGKNKWLRIFSKVLLHRKVPCVDEIQKVKIVDCEKSKIDRGVEASIDEDYEKAQDKLGMEALVAKLFASISTIKAAYAQLQFAQSPYDSGEIQSADALLVAEMKFLSELKQCFVKKQFDSSTETSLILAKIQEQQSLLKSYEIMGKKLGSRMKAEDSEIELLREKLDECNKHNRVLERRLNPDGLLSSLDNLHLSVLSPNHFITVLGHTVKSIQEHVGLMIGEMESSGWVLDSAASSIEPTILQWQHSHMRFAFQAFVSREMFDGFESASFSIPNACLPESRVPNIFFLDMFMELKSEKAMEFLSRNPKSGFAKFCRIKYLQLVHPKMESSFSGSLHQRNLVNSGEFPETRFFASFAEMAKFVWLLHCLAFSFNPEAKIFQAGKKSRFSQVYMRSVCNESAFILSETQLRSHELVAFTVFPGFKIGKTVVQSQVYLSQ